MGKKLELSLYQIYLALSKNRLQCFTIIYLGLPYNGKWHKQRKVTPNTIKPQPFSSSLSCWLMASLKPFKSKHRKRTLDSWTTHHLEKTTQVYHQGIHTLLPINFYISLMKYSNPPSDAKLNSFSLYSNAEIYRILSSRCHGGTGDICFIVCCFRWNIIAMWLL